MPFAGGSLVDAVRVDAVRVGGYVGKCHISVDAVRERHLPNNRYTACPIMAGILLYLRQMQYYPFRNPQRRMKGYDYAKNGYYFVTICTKGRRPWCGKLQQGKMVLSDCGYIIKNQWEWVAKRYPHVHLDEYIVMPDHFHGILVIDDWGDDAVRERHHHPYEPHQHRREPHHPNPSSKKTVGRIIGAFKTTSSKMIHNAGYLDFDWQRSFYDRIIRSERQLQNTRMYIRNNPSTPFAP